MTFGNHSPLARLRAVWLCLVALLAGCQAFDLRDDLVEAPVPEAMIPPREQRMVSHPSYRIEPPDVVTIEMLKMVPLPPYRAEIYDVLQIRVANALPDQPVDNYYLVEAEGVVNLGPAYGTVRVVGMTIDEVKRAIKQKIGQVIQEPEVSVQLARVAGSQSLSGQYLVGPDGTINLRQYGTVHVAGMTVIEARLAIQKHLQQWLDSPELGVDVTAYNSKVYYVITQGAGLGDNVRRFPVTGNETVLDAISQVNGLSQLSSTKMWIARPSPCATTCPQIMPVNWHAITYNAQTATNYQLFPGDRLYIAEDEMIKLSTTVNRLIAPFERVLGFVGLSASTVRTTQQMGRTYNHPANGQSLQ